MWRADSLEKTLMQGKIEGRSRRGWQRMRWLDGIADTKDVFEQAPEVGDGQGDLVCWRLWGHKESDMTKWLNNNVSICLGSGIVGKRFLHLLICSCLKCLIFLHWLYYLSLELKLKEKKLMVSRSKKKKKIE